jgi:hypothetical protein
MPGHMTRISAEVTHADDEYPRVEEHRYPTRQDYLQKPTLRYFDEAVADGSCFAVHTYPKKRRVTSRRAAQTRRPTG